MPRRFWTQTRIAELTRLWRAGTTAAAIGKALGGVTRSAVLGKVFRLRLANAAHPHSAAQRDERPARRRAGKPVPQPVQSKARRKTLFDLTNECCRWPYGELGEGRFFFCGAAGADVARGIPYCPRHMARAYIVPPSLVKPNSLKPLHRLIARAGGKFSVHGDPASRIFPHKRESGGTNSAVGSSFEFPLSRQRAAIDKRKFG